MDVFPRKIYLTHVLLIILLQTIFPNVAISDEIKSSEPEVTGSSDLDPFDNHIFDSSYHDVYNSRLQDKYDRKPLWTTTRHKYEYFTNDHEDEHDGDSEVTTAEYEILLLETTTEMNVMDKNETSDEIQYVTTNAYQTSTVVSINSDANVNVKNTTAINNTEINKDTVEIVKNVTAKFIDGIDEGDNITNTTRDHQNSRNNIHNNTDIYNLNSDVFITEENYFNEPDITIRAYRNTTEAGIIIRNETSENSTQIFKLDTGNDTDSGEAIYPIFSELDLEEDKEVPEDYYDSKEITTKKPQTSDPLSAIFGFAGSVAGTVAEKVLPKGIFDLFKRMQKQSEALELEKLRSREENGGIGQFGRSILKGISLGIANPISQWMQGVRDDGSLDSNGTFVGGVASGVVGVADGVVSMASTVVDSFKDRVQAIFPGTLWCGDGHVGREEELGLFFFTDTCCRQHDACKLYIMAGQTKYGLTNTGIFTRSHCSCDEAFRQCLKRTSSLISSQMGITYFNVLGPQCFRRAHPIVRCLRRTRITGQRCEEYELDYSEPKIWQWFDSETF